MSKHPQNIFGKRLREARERFGIPQDRLGIAIGIDEGCSSTRISRYETGIHEPAFEIAESLAKALHIPAAYFYCESDWVAQLLLETNGFTAPEFSRLPKAALRIRKKRSLPTTAD